MLDVIIIWDLPDDPDGNVLHIAEHDITIDEVEEVLLDVGAKTLSAGHQVGRLPSDTPPADAISPWFGNTLMIIR